MLRFLLSLKRFPIKDSYVSFLRTYDAAIDKNPRTVSRLCGNLYDLGVEGVIRSLSEPPEANRLRGPQFRNWLRRNFKCVDVETFKKSSRGVVLLEASEKVMLEFCNKTLNLGITKRPDLLAKSAGKFIVGEAKFLTALGGNQSRGFEDAVRLATKTTGKAFKVFILDGVIWVSPGSQEFKRIEYSSINVFSALLLRDFLKNVGKNT